ncbi:MAG: transposase [Eubacteriaceae bacterium]|nr:transposase [Eubacteriaceae bacterium]
MRKNYSSDYKAEAVLEVLREAESLGEIAGRLEVHPNMPSRWKTTAVKKLHTVFEDSNGESKRAHELKNRSFTRKSENCQASLLGSKKNLASTFSRSERLGMLDKTDKCYSIKEQCGLLGLNRTSIHSSSLLYLAVP